MFSYKRIECAIQLYGIHLFLPLISAALFYANCIVQYDLASRPILYSLNLHSLCDWIWEKPTIKMLLNFLIAKSKAKITWWGHFLASRNLSSLHPLIEMQISEPPELDWLHITFLWCGTMSNWTLIWPLLISLKDSINF